VKFFIRIKNVSARTCVRDVGAAMQELYLEQSGTKQWSSDACGHQGGNADVRSLQPNLELEYYQVWEGKSTACGLHRPAAGEGPAPTSCAAAWATRSASR
jgi:hypothetical protein